MDRFTERQRDTYLGWVDAQFDIPTVDHYYMMRLICQVARKFAKNPEDIHEHQFQVCRKTRAEVLEDAESAIKLEEVHRQAKLAMAVSAVVPAGTAIVKATQRPAWAVQHEPPPMPDWMR